jgi:hypothetical protein
MEQLSFWKEFQIPNIIGIKKIKEAKQHGIWFELIK